MNHEKQYKNDKKYILASLIITAVATVVIFASNSIKSEIKSYSTQGKPYQNDIGNYSLNSTSSQAQSQEEETNNTKDQYLITIHNGKIGVFKNDEAEPIIVSKISVSLLPEKDVKLLKKGILTDDFKEVRSILEDYE